MEEKKLRLGLVGLGGQGRGHALSLMRAPADFPAELVAVCDIDPEKFKKMELDFNLKENSGSIGFEGYHCYTDVDEMLAKENLDMVSVVVPTYLHCEITVKALRAGAHVLCEKPMALDETQCQLMIDTAKECGKQLLIGQCLRFWGEYIVLKSFVDSGELGPVYAGMFYRGGGTPRWSFNDWYLKKELGGGAIFDQHIHDVDMVQYLFGMPERVSSSAKVIHEGCNYETVCTNYFYPDGKVIFSHNDWTLATPFTHGFRVNFEKGTLEMTGSGVYLSRHDGTRVQLETPTENPTVAETRYLAECALGLHKNVIDPPEDSMATIRLAKTEIASADLAGVPVALKKD